MLKRLSLAASLLIALGQAPAHAASLAGRADVDAYIDQISHQHGLNRDEVRATLLAADTKPSILAIFDKPATGRPWYRFRPSFVNDGLARQGAAFWAKHAELLQSASQIYGVDPAMIVAIIGMETGYGRNTGSFRVLDALATVAFDYPRRASYFQQELTEFLLLAKEERRDPTEFKGSYAGAMGWPQFMPSSFRKWAVDGDADGHRDIWGNPADVIASVAYYFQQHGWQRGGEMVVAATAPKDLADRLAQDKFNLHYTVAELRAMGVTPGGAVDEQARAVLFPLEVAPGEVEYWLGLQNFYTVTRYNKSTLYAMAAHQLADAIRQRRQPGAQ